MAAVEEPVVAPVEDGAAEEKQPAPKEGTKEGRPFEDLSGEPIDESLLIKVSVV